jgi:RimJ/RimL family protein N-acetyltransferase
MCRFTRGVTQLTDGRSVTIRPLDGRDADALVAALQRADPMDLRRRFMGVPPPASFLVKQLRRADGIHDLVLGAFDDTGRLVGVAQFDRVDEKPTAEVAIEVATDWQHDGLGTAMLTRLGDLARERGIHEFTATYYADNLPIRRLLSDIGQVVTSGYESGEGHMRLSLDEIKEAS